MALSRRSFLITASGIVLGTIGLPALPPGSRRQKEKLMIMPATWGPYSMASWLELGGDEWQATLFYAENADEEEKLKEYQATLDETGLDLEPLANAPRRPGKWLVRKQHCGLLLYLMSTDEQELLDPEAEVYNLDAEYAVVLTHDQAIRLAVYMMRHDDDTDAVTHYEPVRRETALERPDDWGVVTVDYLPTGYQRSLE